jgi:hypothetical protein
MSKSNDKTINYYICKNGKAMDIVKQHIKDSKEGNKKTFKLCKKLGGTGQVSISPLSGKLYSIEFEKEPDRNIWAKDSQNINFYRPKKRCKASKEILESFNSITIPTSWSFTFKFFPESMPKHSVGFETIDGKYILSCRSNILEGYEGIKKVKTSKYFAMKGD